ncbi:MAG: DUF3015 domain-containing protein [Nitrospira sp.]|nr:DUF3015 domain-containing protein [Nitrospira sp.]
MGRLLRALIILSCISIPSGCATILDGEKQLVTFSSSPSEVAIYLDGNRLGVTPFSKEMEREKDKVVVVKKEGYEDQVIALNTGMNPKTFLNILWIYFLPTALTTDYASGSYLEYKPNAYHITMTPIRASQTERDRLTKQMRLRNFVLTSYPNLRTDLARGKGEYLASLSRMLRIESPADKTLAQELRRLSSDSWNAPAFAEGIIDHFHNQ